MTAAIRKPAIPHTGVCASYGATSQLTCQLLPNHHLVALADNGRKRLQAANSTGLLQATTKWTMGFICSLSFLILDTINGASNAQWQAL